MKMIAEVKIRPLSSCQTWCQHIGCTRLATHCREVSFRRGGLAFYYECDKHTVPPWARGVMDSRPSEPSKNVGGNADAV